MVKEAKYSKQYIILAFLINKLIDYQKKRILTASSHATLL